MTGPIPTTASVLATFLVLALTGCAGTLPQPGNGARSTQPSGLIEALQARWPKRRPLRQKDEPKVPEQPAEQRPAVPARVAVKADAKQAPLPSREPAQILRIWIAPWEDAAGNLHGASDVFTEITPRRWRLASVAGASAATVLTPLQLEPRKASEPAHEPTPNP
jgi:conjugal transfer pilus assembly protein TraV